MSTCEYCADGATPATAHVAAHGPNGDTIERQLCEPHLRDFLAITGHYDVTISAVRPSQGG